MSSALALLFFLCALLGIAVLLVILTVAREARFARLGRRLVRAAGSEEAAELVVVGTRAEAARTDALMRKGFKSLPRATVLRFRYPDHRRVRFRPDGAA